jgi:hypothetical protein
VTEHNDASAAALFTVLTNIAAWLKAAEKNRQNWKTENTPMRDGNGRMNDGLDIHIRIYPAGVTPDQRTSLVDETSGHSAEAPCGCFGPLQECHLPGEGESPRH